MGCVSSVFWGQLDGFLQVGKAVGEEKKGVCMARSGKAVLFLEEEPNDGLMAGAGRRTEETRWRWAVALGSSRLLKAAEMPQKRCVDSKGQAKSTGVCWLWEGSSSRECIGGQRQRVPAGLGTNPAWEARNLLRPKRELPRCDSAQPLVSGSLSSA